MSILESSASCAFADESSRALAVRTPVFRRNYPDRVGSDEDKFSSPTFAAPSIDGAAAERAKRIAAVTKLLVDLEALFKEDFGNDLRTDSKNDAKSFLRMTFAYSTPLLSAEPDGTLLATWKRDAESVVLRFKGQSLLDFAIAIQREHGIIERTWGSQSIMGFFDVQADARAVVTR